MMKQNQRKQIVLFPFPFQGHVTPMLHLANQLHTKSYSITIIQTRFNSIDPTRFPHFTFHLIEDHMPRNSRVSSDNLVESMSAMQLHCQVPFRECLGRALDDAAAHGDRVCCVIYDAIWSFAGTVADGLKVPGIVLRTSSVSAFVVNDRLPILRDKGYFRPGVKRDELVEELPPFKVRDLPGEEHHDILAAVVKLTKASHGVICNSFEELEPLSISRVREILSIPVFPVGPLHKHSASSTTSIWQQDKSSLTWLNTQAPNSVLYVSFGSVAAMKKSDFVEIAWGLANSSQPFLWVVRSGLSQGLESNDLFPEGYLDMIRGRGHIVKWAPQLEVLAHRAVGGFLTHCGWNSTVESVSEGVPMVCLPFLVDQAMNARYVSDVWKVGVLIEDGIKRDNIERGIRKLMAEPEGEELRKRAKSLMECAKKSYMEGGSSYESLEALSKYISSL
uniref:Glycosyltransferase n=1 Tax=Dianthus caryophyllus TaxID=3570 RepID=Q60FE8_DIACA|nr:UDP-glucose: chalcononaringenin 2'-O-glucosyltransferase [Dianthus caryophyllus]BBD75332.1 chalcononaringenin 2'-O-glucosyltransferase [Dianthus caryophyllus]